ncbi:MAG: discoidin domain-containing protein [Planctomycetes bacterium]|nr:discoidin domain-containing protein [Planctomycetota bacterium]
MRAKTQGIELDYDRPKVVILDVTEPLALLTIYACRTGQFDKIPMVLNPGGPSGMINHQLEIWFDRAKMKKFYADNPKRLLGNTITEKWYTSQLLQVDVVPLKGTVRLPANSIPLRATVKSAGPDPAGGDYAVRWKLLEGDGQAEFSKPDKLDTWAGFDRPGTYAIEVTVTGDGRMGSAGIIVEVLGSADADAPPFGEWIAGYASIDADKRGPADDPDGDGIANLLEKFFGGNPSRADAELAPRLVGEKKNRRIQFRQSKKLSAGASYVLQYRQAKDKDAWRLASGVVFRQTRELAGSTLMEAELPGWLNEERPVDFRFAVIEPDVNYAPRAKVSVSSAHSRDYAGSKAVDGIKGIRGNGEWCAALDKATPWIQLDWPKPVSIRMVHLFDRPNPVDHTRTGTLTFSDGSSIGVADIANNGSMKRIVFDPKTVTWVRFQVTGGSGRNRGLDEIEALSYPILKAHSATLRTVPR